MVTERGLPTDTSGGVTGFEPSVERRGIHTGRTRRMPRKYSFYEAQGIKDRDEDKSQFKETVAVNSEN